VTVLPSSLSLLPQDGAPLGIAVAALKMPTLEARLDWAAENGFTGVELLATGEPWGVHTPGVTKEERARLREHVTRFARVAVMAPHQATWDVTLVSPSAAIRRASVSEIWSVCRFADAIGGAVVLVRSGMPPAGVPPAQAQAHLIECLTTLDRMAGDHNARIGLLNADLLADLSAFAALSGLSLPNTGIALDLTTVRPDDAQVTALLSRPAGNVLHLRIPGLDVPTRLAAPAAGMVCLAFEGTASPPSPEEIVRRRAEWARYIVPRA